MSFADPQEIARFSANMPMPFPVVSDPDRTTYKALALDRTTWSDMLRPRILWRYLKLMSKGWMPWKTQSKTDLLQLGGDFVIDADRRLVYAHRSVDPTDRPTIDALISAVKKASLR